VPIEWFGVMAAGVFGAAFGSFLNVCIVRLPEDGSLLKPPSRCPQCGTSIAWYDNIPIVSWLVLRGRCRQCGKGISIQYPIIEAVTAALWAAAAWYYVVAPHGPATEWHARLDGLTAAIFGTILLGIAVTDARHYLIPDEYTWGGLIIGLMLSWRGVLDGGSFSWRLGLDGFLAALIGAATGFVLLYFVAWAGEKAFGKEAMGGGDIKMMTMVGAFVGWKGVLLTIFGGALLGTLIFVPLSLKQKRLVPFGVFLAAAAAVTFVFGDQILTWYLGFAGGP
jgi:leader peptidase (prepilin peptidase)/N-methyltransferase